MKVNFQLGWDGFFFLPAVLYVALLSLFTYYLYKKHRLSGMGSKDADNAIVESPITSRCLLSTLRQVHRRSSLTRLLSLRCADEFVCHLSR